MDLQTIFYIVGITAMLLWIFIILVVVGAVIKIRKEVDSFKKGFMGKIVSIVKDRNVEVASALGLTVAHFVIDKLQKTVEKKRKTS